MEQIESVQVVLSCSSLNETAAFFKEKLGFHILMVSPADDPSIMILRRQGLDIRLERCFKEQNIADHTTLRVHINSEHTNTIDEEKLIAPNGTIIQLVRNQPEIIIPKLAQTFVVNNSLNSTNWIVGRAGMQYRDLIPGRQGGRFIASHIRIIDGGPVQDSVHYHNIRFQIIYVYKGWVRLVYEDQGPPFILHAGDCVLQPPMIRHRVLESSPGLEVIEVACPAVHDTYFDENMTLPTNQYNPSRDFHGQYFTKYIESEDQSEWNVWRIPGFESKSLGIGIATNDLAEVNIVRAKPSIKAVHHKHEAEFVFLFVLQGNVTLIDQDGKEELLSENGACVLIENHSYLFKEPTNDLKMLEVVLPGTLKTIIQENN